MNIQKKKPKKVYATIFEDDGIDYRVIAKVMTEAGWPCNHTSSRNYLLRIMKKFAEAYTNFYDMDPTEEKLNEVSRDARFQSFISDMLQVEFYSKSGERK